MEKIANYLDIPQLHRDAVLERLPRLGFCPAKGGQAALRREMDRSQRGKLPQFGFAFRGEELVGYLFLTAKPEKPAAMLPWWAVGNADELPLETAVRLLEWGIALSSDCGCPALARLLQANLNGQKQGAGRRRPEDCR